uniref:Phosphatidic acid phosphatase type 2/haloperoxidase domain-containing protein n=1 Tax=Leersia perrieri TaxID=77586 RepID=A0A0D9V950_9ORYZ
MGDDGGGDGASAASSASGPPGFSYFAVFHNYPLIAALLGFAVAQSIKFFVTRYKEKRWDPKQLIGSGGMPSSHSATVTALAVAIGFQDGFGSALFATAAIFASVVMYDASGIRLHAGKQAEVLNQIVCELPSEHPLSETRPLRELLGHTPTQVVAGALLGFVLATTGQMCFAVADVV